MKRILVLGAAAGTAVVLVVGIAGAAGPAPSGFTRQSAAQRILKVRGKYLTASAQAALRMVANNDRQLSPGPQRLGRGTSESGGSGSSESSSLTNVRVNDPALDSHQVDQTTQSETAVTASGNNVVVGYNDSQHTGLFLTAASSLSGYSYSTNGGASFTDGDVLPNTPEFVNLGDPWLASDRAGNMYYSTLAIDAVNQNLDVAVAKSGDGGKTWSNPVPVTRPPFEVFYSGDKDAMAVGRDPAQARRDNIYVAYDDFVFDLTTGAAFNGLPVARSTDGGASWQITYADKVNAVDLVGCSFAQYIGAVPLVAKDGTLYVASEKITVDDPDCLGVAPTFSEWIFKSTNGGQTFGPGVKIADVTPSFPTGALQLGAGQYVRNLEFPTIAVLGSSVYAAWNDGAGGHSHLKLARSTNGGATWTVSSATSGSNDELQPSLTADDKLHLLYYRRNHNNTLDVYVGNSSNGSSWTTRRVTTRSSPGVFTNPQFDPIIAPAYMGDYIASASDGDNQYFAWGDNRNVVTNFLWPQGRHDPDVFFARQ